jgi:hypothetical protein
MTVAITFLVAFAFNFAALQKTNNQTEYDVLNPMRN